MTIIPTYLLSAIVEVKAIRTALVAIISPFQKIKMTLLSKYLGVLFTSLFITGGLHAQTNFNHLKLKNPSKDGFTLILPDSLTVQLNDSIPCLGSFLIWKNGGLIYEKYFHGADSMTEFNIKSVTKSVVSALGGGVSIVTVPILVYLVSDEKVKDGIISKF